MAESGKLDAIAVINSRKRREYAFPLATQSNEIQLKYYEQHGLTLSAPEKTALQKVKPSPVQRPLDSYTEKPVGLMEVVAGDPAVPVLWDTYREILNRYEPEHCEIEFMERFAFYERAKKAYAVIATGETAIYANVLLKKGVVLPEETP